MVLCDGCLQSDKPTIELPIGSTIYDLCADCRKALFALLKGKGKPMPFELVPPAPPINPIPWPVFIPYNPPVLPVPQPNPWPELWPQITCGGNVCTSQ